ncbi:hypothetical protein [Actinoplanes sp. OR16]|uniref:hypothetical protein n=1 Tax=Actinoplanes sp. OR16 TaxID=946334 RepID=UPI000FDB1479|nr:hypothetical protein [Actinoplanes sp. OR16]
MRRAFLSVAMVALLAGCGDTAAGVTARPVTGAVTPSTATPAIETTAPASATPVEPSTTPAWRPDCDPSVDCEDFSTDSCDAAYAAEELGGLIDSFIEDKEDVDADRLKAACPQYLKAWNKAKNGVTEGSYEVGTEIKAGTYQTTAHLIDGRVTDCYWERSGKNGDIIANAFVIATKKVSVTVRSSDEMFTSKGCGNWQKIK